MRLTDAARAKAREARAKASNALHRGPQKQYRDERVARLESGRDPEWRPAAPWGIGPAQRMVEIDSPDGSRVLARWEGRTWTMRGAIAKADAMRTDQWVRPARTRDRQGRAGRI